MFGMNLYGARGWGEAEYWFSLIKIICVIVFVIVGCFTSGGVISGTVYGFKYWKDPGAFSHGVLVISDSFLYASIAITYTKLIVC